jgi:OOP family OmpA-OmpF porin
MQQTIRLLSYLLETIKGARVMSIRKLLMAVGAAVLATGAWSGAMAQSSDSAFSTSSLFGWDNPNETRPGSWLPYTSYGYVGGGVGKSKYDTSCAPGFACDHTDIGYKIFTGGKISRVIGVEVAYVYLGKGTANGGDQTAQGINLSLIGNIPIGEKFNVYGKVGGIWGWTKTDTASLSGQSGGTDHGLNWSYGAGVQFDLSRNWAVQADWDHYRFDYSNQNAGAELYSVNAVYKF